jgi:hypothetical protein
MGSPFGRRKHGLRFDHASRITSRGSRCRFETRIVAISNYTFRPPTIFYFESGASGAFEFWIEVSNPELRAAANAACGLEFLWVDVPSLGGGGSINTGSPLVSLLTYAPLNGDSVSLLVDLDPSGDDRAYPCVVRGVRLVGPGE